MNDNSFSTLPFYTLPSLRNACKLECKKDNCNKFFATVGQQLSPFIFCTDQLLTDPFFHVLNLFREDDTPLPPAIPIRINQYDCEGVTYVWSNADMVDTDFNLSAANWTGTGDLLTIGQATLDNGEFIVTGTQLIAGKSYTLYFNDNSASGDYEVYLTNDNVLVPVTESIFDGSSAGQVIFPFVPVLANLWLVIRYKVAAVPAMVINDLSLTCPWITDDIECGTIGYVTIVTEGTPVTFYSEIFKSKKQALLNCDHNKFIFSNPCDIECWKFPLLDPMFIYLTQCVVDGGATGNSAVWKPTYPVTIEGDEDEDSIQVDVFKKVEKTYGVGFNLIPQYLMDLVNNLPFFDVLTITRDDLDITSIRHDIAGDPDWQENGCFGDVVLNVITHKIEKTGCCDCATPAGGGD